MFYFLLILHIILCVALVTLVLLQQGKGADMGAAFGGNSSSLFGAGGAADFVTKATTGLAIAFMFTSIALVRSYTGFSNAGGGVTNPLQGSLMMNEPAAAPASPATGDTAPAAAPAAVPADAAPAANPAPAVVTP